VVFTTDNGAEVYTWPDGGTTPFMDAKGEVTEGSFRGPAIIRWPGHIKPGSVGNGIMSGLDWFPTLLAAAGNPNITQELLKGTTLDGKTFKVHLDGYDQTPVVAHRTDMRSGILRRPSSARFALTTGSISSSTNPRAG
jgi:arylsulfatase A-like enzyme